MANRRKPTVPDELLDQLLDGSDALEVFQSGDLVQGLKKALAERILNAELDHHLDDEEERSSPHPSPTSCCGRRCTRPAWLCSLQPI